MGNSGKVITSSLMGLLLVSVVTGCQGGDKANVADKADQKPPPAVQKKLDPVNLTLYHQGGYFTNEDFQLLLADPVNKKYPHITLQMVASSKSLQDLFAAGERIDMYATFYGNLANYTDLNFLGDLTGLAKTHNFDLNRFDPGALDAVRTISGNGQLWALPYNRNINALYYNKTIFDMFGVPYPKDGMTWDETIDLAKRLTRDSNGIKYKGLEPNSIELLMFQRSLTNVDAKTSAVMENMERYKQAFELGKQIYSIPGNEFVASGNPNARFSGERNVAMYASINLFSRYMKIAKSELNWGVAQFPSFADAANTGSLYDLHVIAPNKNSKSPDDVMRVMEVLFSDEVQTDLVRKTGRVSVLKDEKYKQQFAKDITEMQGIDVSSVFKSKPAPAPAFSKYTFPASPILDKKFKEYVSGTKDVNTALREAKEEIEKVIADDRKK